MKIKYYLFYYSLIFGIAVLLIGCSNQKPYDSTSSLVNNKNSPIISIDIPEEIDKIDTSFLKGLGIKIRSEYQLWDYKVARLIKLLGYDNNAKSYQTKIKLSKDFESAVNKVEIGKFLHERNKQSKEYGFDFSKYMGKELSYIKNKFQW